MKNLLILFVIVLFSSCLSGRFINQKSYIDRIPSMLSIDSVLLLKPAFTMSFHSANRDFNYPLRQNGRPDSFIRMLNSLIKEKLGEINKEDFSSQCMDNKIIFNKWSLDDSYEFEKHKCLPQKAGKYNLFFNVAMNVSEASADFSTREFESFHCYVLVIKDSAVLYYKHFFSHRTARKSRFPKGSKEREEYPYFANDQIERVVKEITKDLLARIKPNEKK